MAKEELLNRMIKDPLQFTDEDFLLLVSLEGKEAVTFDDLRNNIRRIYDMNESSLLRESDAMAGPLGNMNAKKQIKRRKNFFKRIREGKRTTDYKTIVAEGDSWFCFPKVITDINQWLIKDPRINLYSEAAAGDWIANMIYEGKYIEELSLIEPDVFLISGGGNDFVGSYRLSFMINTNIDEDLPDDKFIKDCIADAFYAFIWTLKTQYWLLLSSLQKAEKLQGLKVITQGYDYVIPSLKKLRGPDPFQWIINQFFTDTGDWLCTPFKLKGLHNEERQKKIIRHFIDKVNEMFAWLANYPNVDGVEGKEFKFLNFYHIDCRGVARKLSDWFDEIHLKSHGFKEIANVYKHIIFESTRKVTNKGKEVEIAFKKERKVVKVNLEDADLSTLK